MSRAGRYYTPAERIDPVLGVELYATVRMQPAHGAEARRHGMTDKKAGPAKALALLTGGCP